MNWTLVLEIADGVLLAQLITAFVALVLGVIRELIK